MTEDVMIIVNPEYHNILRFEFVDRIIQGLEPLGIEPVRIFVKAEEHFLRDGRKVLVPLTYLAVDDSKSYLIYDQDIIVESIVHKALENLNDALKKRGILAYIPEEGLKIDFTTSEEYINENKASIIVDGPDEYVKELERFGKGIVIQFKDKGVKIESFVISAQEFYTGLGQRKGLKLDFALTLKREGLQYSKETIEEFLLGAADRYASFLLNSLNLAKITYGSIHIIMPGEKKAPSIVLNQIDKILEEVEEITNDERIQELVTILK
ncbi:hypothetical protein PAP_06545 [Palaeococcus pacificus DY20341]|uniref:Uncharacterized protein n=1 Tax=Palaeococcus pacificus DY20341 TaxID=1343739 RepID=A0A075LU95_9EURY|nr:hypothetical protein [Palaeococcus pacificus]AIF69706.1 hypothetical protein PAP_06545 [Palaeococcus pacificus DY20341]